MSKKPIKRTAPSRSVRPTGRPSSARPASGRGGSGASGGGRSGGGRSGGGRAAGSGGGGKKAPSRRRRRSRRSRLLTIAIWLLGLACLGMIVGVLGLVWLYNRTEIPDPNEVAQAQSSIVYYSDGTTELARFSGEADRESVPLAQVPESARYAMLAAEDRSFYRNQGISPVGIARALWSNVTTGTTQGGSTITQQYVKNFYLSSDQTLGRKVDEAMIAVRLDRELSKDQILENYLNTIYFGRGAYGIQTASQAYFGKDAADLDLSEGAFLAAVTNAPSLYDPSAGEGNLERAEQRWRYVLNGMVEEGWADAAEAEAATFPEIAESRPNTASGSAGYIQQEVRRELVDTVGIEESEIDRAGLRITTTIDAEQQAAAEAAVRDNIPDGADTEGLRTGLVAVRPGDGAITAMYGGADYVTEQLNAVTDARLQAGSTFKPITLAAALAEGESTENVFPGYSPQYFGSGEEPYEVNNFRDEQFGRITLITATAYSVNTVYVALNEQIGPEHTREMAVELGIPEDTPGLDDFLSNVLGTASPRVIDVAAVYATLAAEGERADPYLVASATSADGSIDYSAEPEPEQVLDADIAIDVTDAMTAVMTEGSGRDAAAQLGERPAAGKTGTSENNLSVWFSGYTPQLVATVGMYNGDGTEPMQDIAGFDQVTGSTFPAAIWGDFMSAAMAGEPIEEFPERVGVNDDAIRTPPPAPTSEEPTTEEPTTEEPTTEEPTTEEPTTEEPTTEEPTQEPTTEEPEPTQEPTTEEPEPTPPPSPSPSPTAPASPEDPEPTQEPTDEPTDEATDEATDDGDGARPPADD